MAAQSKRKILLIGEIEHPKAKEAWQSLSTHGDLISIPPTTTPASFLQQLHAGTFNGIYAAQRTFASVSLTGRIEGDVAAALGKAGLKFLSHNGAGYDQCNVPDCTAAGIQVSNVPTIVDAATADTAIFLMLGAMRGFNVAMGSLRRGEFRGREPPPLGHDPEGKTLGILGMGGIGRDMKGKAEALGMTVIYHNRNPLSEELAGGAQYVTFDDLLAKSDVISCNLPLNKSTRHILSARQFAAMKPGVVLINTARGPIIDEAALVDALDRTKGGKVFSAGLDVFEEEPKIHPGLVDNPHVMLLPHMGTWTAETQEKMELFVVENVRSVLEGKGLVSLVPEQRGVEF